MSGQNNQPDMNIANQINAALNDVRTTLVELATWAKTPDISDRVQAEDKAHYQLQLAMTMIRDHRIGKASIPWSDRKYIVEEEFSLKGQ